MDLRRLLLRLAAARPHVLLVALPGATEARLAVEAELGRRGWPAAVSPADADVLLVAGPAGPAMAAVVGRVWEQMPEPRVRVVVEVVADVSGTLDSAASQLASWTAARPEYGGPGPREQEHRGPEHRGPEHGGDEHGGHGGGMEMPGGLPMADLGEDRDGLMLDRLHVALGPVLPDWPAGLVLRVELQGDVIQEAEAEVLDPGRGGSSRGDVPAAEDARHAAARHLDGLARFLGVAGWADPAARARRLRDDLLAGAEPAAVRGQVHALTARVRRSRTLRWLVRGIPAGERAVAARLADRLAALDAAVDGVPPAQPGPSRPPDLAALARAVVGAELAAARLVVAAVDPDTDLVAEERGARHA
ncbi:MAG: hypothetical protein QOJ30_777 [Pseudonocardiales bacterium]|jgi:hypothetical protein|nr:hypothetical protein [Pseudonocardiales bacterium]